MPQRLPRYCVSHSAAVGTDKSIIVLEGLDSARALITSFVLGLDTPVDAALRFELIRPSSLRTGGTPLTPRKLDPLSPASAYATGVFGGPFTADPLVSQTLLTIPLRQRMSAQWDAVPGGELVQALSGSAGELVLMCRGTSAGTPNVSAVLHWMEEAPGGIA